MINFIRWYPDDYCSNCKRNTLKLVTARGNKCGFNNYNDNTIYDHIVCDNCGTIYNIDWSNKKPRSLRTGNNIDIFIYKWKR